jgi:TolB-like protein
MRSIDSLSTSSKVLLGMKNILIINSIQSALNQVGVKLNSNFIEFNMDGYKKTKSTLSAAKVSEIFGVNESMLNEFEETLRQFYTHQLDNQKTRLSCLRLSLWLETITKNMNIVFEFEKALSSEETAIKQVRALELIVRDVITEQLGGKENLIFKLQELFKQEVIDKWIKSADQSGVLSGTTFSELSNILLDKNIFIGIEEIFHSSDIELSKSTRDSLRYILEDIRVIRNAIAHNKKVSNIQIEALNEYYKTIAEILKNAKKTNIDPDSYLDLSKANMEEYISSLKEDHKEIFINLENIKEKVIDIKTDTEEIRKDSTVNKKRSLFIILGIIALLLITFTMLFLQQKQTNDTATMGSDMKEVKEIVKGDGELKNMSSTDDLSATKDLNKRTKDKNAKRLAIIYFDNSGGDHSMDKLKKGLADMLITDLSNINMLAIVERDKLESILKEQKLSNSKEFAPATAAKVGKLLGAQIILTGGYFEMMGSLRLDARFIDVETGKILKSDGVDGQLSNFFKIQKQLAWKIINTLDIKISAAEKKDLETNENSKALTYEDANLYSKALDYYDTGEKKKAKDILSKLNKTYPDFAPVKNMLTKL